MYITTTIFALFAYIWLYWCLLDGVVDPVEAWLTLFFFVALIAVSYAMDKIGERKMAKEKAQEEERTGVSKPSEDAMPVTVQTSYTPAMFYNLLIPIEAGKVDEESMDPKEKQRIDRMRGFLKANFNTDKVQDIEFADLKQKI